MLSGAPERLRPRRSSRERAQGAVLALLVQASFVLLIFSSRPATEQHPLAHETILLLHPLPETRSQTIDARGPPLRRSAPTLVPIPILPNFTPPVLAPPSGIAGFGRSLFGCAPEKYADLPPDEKAHCPKPGEGLAINQPPDLLNPPKSHAKDEALWLEERAEANWNSECAGAVEVGFCIMHQSMAEHRRAQAARQKIADDKAATLQVPKRPLPNIGVRRN